MTRSPKPLHTTPRTERDHVAGRWRGANAGAEADHRRAESGV